MGNDLVPVPMDTVQLPVGNFRYSAARVDLLSAAEYTLVPLIFDESGSTTRFAKLIEKGAAEIVKCLRRSPRADNLMIRATAFGSRVREIEGFKPLMSYDPDKCDGWYQPGGMTAMYDGSVEGIRATTDYAKTLHGRDYLINMIGFIITDGDESGDSLLSVADVRKELEDAVEKEYLESALMVLIGVNIKDPHISQRLKEFQNDAGFTKYIELENADEASIAKLVDFVSQSVSSQSQHLGSGGPSQQINQIASLTI